ncbi:MAG: Type 1 glutamine amidotransferase-like domain-containing protein [Candidatus Gracilibacteria bacterium]|nr:Type 1 glutamine amidotransferase-like domain-containing protein [Candidatus Gracilibacteria bacterium]
MIKFILHGGDSSSFCDENKKFFKTVFCNIKKEKILYIPFAQDMEKWKTSFLEEKIGLYIKNRKYNITVASVKKIDLIIQIISSKVIFIPGGDFLKLMPRIYFLKHLRFLFRNKIIVGVSAGTNIFSRYSYSQDYDDILEGLGFLNIKTICHFDEENDIEKVKRLDKRGHKYEIIRLKEKEFMIMEI